MSSTAGAKAPDQGYSLIEIQKAFERVVHVISYFNAKWPVWVSHIEVYPIPVRAEPKPFDEVKPGYLSGPDAIELVQQALGQLSWQEGQHEATTWRVPGVVLLNQSVEHYIQEINAAKNELKRVMGTVPEGSRAWVRSRLFSSVSLLQAYRQVVHVEEPLRRLLFTWNGRSSGSKSLTLQQTEKLLQDSLRYRPENKTVDEWKHVIDIQLDKLRRLGSDAQIRQRRPSAPHPRMLYYYADTLKDPEEPRHDGHHPANLPIFVHHRPGRALPRIDALGKFDIGDLQAVRKDHGTYSPFIKQLGLYVLEKKTAS